MNSEPWSTLIAVEYLADVITRIVAGQPQSLLDDLLPKRMPPRYPRRWPANSAYNTSSPINLHAAVGLQATLIEFRQIRQLEGIQCTRDRQISYSFVYAFLIEQLRRLDPIRNRRRPKDYYGNEKKL